MSQSPKRTIDTEAAEAIKLFKDTCSDNTSAYHNKRNEQADCKAELEGLSQIEGLVSDIQMDSIEKAMETPTMKRNHGIT